MSVFDQSVVTSQTRASVICKICSIIRCLELFDAMYCGRRALLFVRNLRGWESEQVPLNHRYTPKLWILFLCLYLVCYVSAVFITTTVVTTAFTPLLFSDSGFLAYSMWYCWVVAISRFMDWATNWTSEEFLFYSWQGLVINLFSRASGWAVGPSQPSVQCIPGAHSVGLSGQGVKLTANMSSANSENEWHDTFILPFSFMVCVWGWLYSSAFLEVIEQRAWMCQKCYALWTLLSFFATFWLTSH